MPARSVWPTAPTRCTETRSGSWSCATASVLSPKFGDYFGEQSASLARRADAGISGIFRGGATRPGASRAGEIVGELRRQDTSACRAGPQRRAAAVPRASRARHQIDGDAVGVHLLDAALIDRHRA